MIFFACIIYLAAIIAANLIVASLGPWVSPILGFVFIGFDLSMRDWLHIRLKAWQMLALIAIGGVVTYTLNPAAAQIAVASSVAFTVAATADWATFATLRGSWLKRSNGSNIVGAAVDSVLFPTLAFGVLLPHIILMQFVAKVAGGALWSWLLSLRRVDEVSA